MIPKIIHYCWFGENPLPELAVKCIESWKQYFPAYEIKEWNESNFDLNCCNYVKEAYEEKMWAFVSDYARYWILYHEGGLYFDTDVEIIKKMDDIISKGSFMGCEPVNGRSEDELKYKSVNCAPGLGMGLKPGLSLIKEILDSYNLMHFRLEDGRLNKTTIVKYTSDILIQYGWIPNGRLQCIRDIYIYPTDYFCPINYETTEMNITENTRSIHHYTASWLSKKERKYHTIKQKLRNRFGYEIGTRIGLIIDFPYRVRMKIKEKGIYGTIKFTYEKLSKRK